MPYISKSPALFTNSFVSSTRIIYTASPFARTSLLHLQECGTLKAIKPHVSSRSDLASYLFFLVLDGAGVLTYEGVTHELTKGDCVYIDCRKPYSQSSSEELWTLKWCHFYGPNAAAVYRKYKERGGYDVFRPKSQVWSELDEAQSEIVKERSGKMHVTGGGIGNRREKVALPGGDVENRREKKVILPAGNVENSGGKVDFPGGDAENWREKVALPDGDVRNRRDEVDSSGGIVKDRRKDVDVNARSKTHAPLSVYEKLIDDIYTLACGNSYTRDMAINLKLTELTTLLMEESWHEERQVRESGSVQITEVKTYIDTHYRDRLTLESLATDFYISKSYLARLFREQFGLTVAAYIQQVRVGKGKELLRFSGRTVEEVGRDCGYEDPNYFCRVFKKVEGCSPSEYRRMWESGDKTENNHTKSLPGA